ncbi:hypothetical protein GBAR_LOCUS11271 [Geodia barretti]|uniref:Uncharacterized protein n=1 Tax=Geodia barretti TaxID=519541 RepID=A0AA35WFK6_GEOBA|nr:hypothetical protein GBAR_LOCUS11271 [Geodia barretti]
MQQLTKLGFCINSCTNVMTHDTMPSPAPGFLCRFMLELKKEQKLVYTRKVTTMAHNIGYTSEIHNSTKLEDLNYLAFSRARTS